MELHNLYLIILVLPILGGNLDLITKCFTFKCLNDKSFLFCVAVASSPHHQKKLILNFNYPIYRLYVKKPSSVLYLIFGRGM